MLRAIAFSLAAAGALLLLFAASLSVYGAIFIDTAEDERLFAHAGADTFTRLYYHAQGGDKVEGLEGYLAVEWESERLSSGERCVYTPMEGMPSYLPAAFVAIEDHRFYRHGGVDVLRTGKAVANVVFRFSDSFGGSTITQQLIKNIGGEKERTASRKIREMLRARALERRHTKDEILEAYLNIVPMSGGCVGVGAGSLFYFGKEPSTLTLAEAASIAAVTRAPALYAPERHPEEHIARRNLVLARLAACGMIDESAAKEAQKEPLVLQNGLREGDGVCSWYTEKVIDDVKEGLLSKGYTEAAAQSLIYRGGLKIYTAVDIEAQRTAEEYFESSESFSGYGEDLIASLVLLSPDDGRRAAIVGNRGKKTANRLLCHASRALYAPGSALKPIALYAPAVEGGYVSEATVFDDVPKSFSSTGCWPKNSPDAYEGLIPAKEALARSKNTAAVSIYHMLGAERIYATLDRLGIDTLVRRRSTDSGVLTDLAPAPLALGELTDGVTLLSLTRAYMPLADEGRLHAARSYLLVLDREGRVLLSQGDESEEVFSPATASVLTHMLTGVTEEGSAKALTLPERVPVAGKTGTSGGGRNRLFVGYTPRYLCGVLCTYGDGRALVGDVHLSVFDDVMGTLYKDVQEKESFSMADGLCAVRVCRDSGCLASHACALDPRGHREITVWVAESQMPTGRCAVHTELWYDEAAHGVVIDPAHHTGTLKRISLVRVTRDFPLDIAVCDAEYTARELGDTPPASGDQMYYASLLEDGHYAGRRADGGRPFNALAGASEQRTKKEEAPAQRRRPSPPALPSEGAWRRFFKKFREKGAKGA